MSNLPISEVNALEASAAALRAELEPLAVHLITGEIGGLRVTTSTAIDPATGKACFVVFGPSSAKALLPKKYDGWPVKFIEWDGTPITYSKVKL